MRCDLHLHSRYSGPAEPWPLGLLAQESYSEPRAVYGAARRRGMDLVTLTDHDSIAGALEIASLPGTFVSEEVSCTLPGGRRLHVGVFGISEAQHEAIARRRPDAEALFAYLAEERTPAAVNHPFSALTGRRETVDLHRALSALDLVECRNGMMSEAVNSRAARAGRAAGRSPVGGSDAPTLASVARAYTVVPRARTREDFLDGLRRGFTAAPGTGGGTSGRRRRPPPRGDGLSPLLLSVNAADLRLSHRLRAWAPPRWFRVWMVAATRFGDGPGWIAVALGLLASGAHGRAAVARGGVAALVASLTFIALKRRFRRRRPCDIAPHPVLHVRPPDAFSFPSGHTMNAFAIATVLAMRFPALSPALLPLAACIGASRVVLGLHFASDVWAGAALGALIGWACSMLCP